MKIRGRKRIELKRIEFLEPFDINKGATKGQMI
jgi:hypothetical protein